MVTLLAFGLAGVIVGQRLIELFIARRNRRYIESIGGQEAGGGHYPLFFILHGGWLAGWIYEAISANELSGNWPVWLGLFVLAQGLRYWCMLSLGRFWNTRIFVVPGQSRVQTGPYRFIAHPNYLAVCIELACVPLLFNAGATALSASLVNALLLGTVRIPAEERALRQLQNS